jgi:hypothetical protein
LDHGALEQAGEINVDFRIRTHKQLTEKVAQNCSRLALRFWRHKTSSCNSTRRPVFRPEKRKHIRKFVGFLTNGLGLGRGCNCENIETML